MTYKITAHTSTGNLTVEVEGKSKFLALDLAQHYFRAAFGDDFTMTHKTTEDTKTVWIVECGSLYSSDPWKIEGVFATEEAAKEYIKHSNVPELLHPSEWSVRG